MHSAALDHGHSGIELSNISFLVFRWSCPSVRCRPRTRRQHGASRCAIRSFAPMNRTLPLCREYVFGFSPGHTGTTTLSSPSSYVSGSRNKSSVGFAFEVGVFQPRGPRTVAGQVNDVNLEVHHARHTYLPALHEQIGQYVKPDDQLDLCVDLSHTNLYFFRGLVQVMREDNMRFRWVRIRRDGVETARSLTHSSTMMIPAQYDALNRRWHNRFSTWVGFHPWGELQSVVLKVRPPCPASLQCAV